MTRSPSYSGVYIAEGSSDLPLADVVESLFLDRGVSLRLSKPDFSLLARKVSKDVRWLADATGRRKDAVQKRFNHHRRQLLERLDPDGPVTNLASWKRLIEDIDAAVRSWQN